MSIKYKNQTLRSQIRNLFIAIGLVVLVGGGVLVGLSYRLRSHQKNVEKMISIDHQLEGLSNMIKDPNDQRVFSKIGFSNAVDSFEVSFVRLMHFEVGDQFDSLSKKTPETLFLSLKDFDDQDQVLLYSWTIWTKLKKHTDYITFHTLSQDSVVFDVAPAIVSEFDSSGSASTTPVDIVPRTMKVITPEAISYLNNAELLITKLRQQLTALQEYYLVQEDKSVEYFKWVCFVVLFLVVVFIVLSSFILNRQLFVPFDQFRQSLFDFMRGNQSQRILITGAQEIEEVSMSLNKVLDDIDRATKFVQQIHVQTDDLLISEGHELTLLDNALLTMKNELREIEQKEKDRNWSIQGQAIFSEILGKKADDFEELVDEIISTLAKYLNVLQGAIFIINSDQGKKRLKMVSSYAYSRKNHAEKEISLGEGLVGQSWQEERTIYVDDLPEEHSNIRSGLGESKPKCVLIVPLMDNTRYYGAIELASFNFFKEHEIEFVQKIASSIATTLSSVEINNKTQKLLEESQLLTERMRAQEEEMLQNLEELQATQEELKRREIQKENELHTFTARLNRQMSEHKALEEQLRGEIELLKQQVLASETDNEAIRAIQRQMVELEESYAKQIADLNETIKIKDIRIEKMRKRLGD